MTSAPHRPLPKVDGKMAPFWEGARAGKLLLQRCGACGHHRFPAGDLCSRCLEAALEWVPASGSAELFSFVVVHHTLDPYFAERAPYVVADVKLAEGPHMTSTVVGASAYDLRIGAALRVEFEAVGENVRLPVFRPIDA